MWPHSMWVSDWLKVETADGGERIVLVGVCGWGFSPFMRPLEQASTRDRTERDGKGDRPLHEGTGRWLREVTWGPREAARCPTGSP